MYWVQIKKTFGWHTVNVPIRGGVEALQIADTMSKLFGRRTRVIQGY